MSFTPMSDKEYEDERASQGVWPAGEYEFKVLDSVILGQNNRTFRTDNMKSKAGKDMIQLVCQVYHPTGKSRTIIDYIMFEVPLKHRDAFYTCGLEEQYRAGNDDARAFIGKTGVCKLKVEKDPNGQYSDSNKIADYVVRPSSDSAVAKKDGYQGDTYEDSIPY